MKSLLYIGGPLILFTWFAFHSDLITFANEKPGLVHLEGIEKGGSFFSLKKTEYYQCDEGGNCVLVDENTEFSEIDGLEFEQEAIEYREGSGSEYNVSKQPGIPKYTDITIGRMPTGIDWKAWKFTFERQAALQEFEEEYDGEFREILRERAEELKELEE